MEATAASTGFGNCSMGMQGSADNKLYALGVGTRGMIRL